MWLTVSFSMFLTLLKVSKELIHHYITSLFSMCFSESEVPILTTHQAPTVMKGADLIIYLNLNSIYLAFVFFFF